MEPQGVAERAAAAAAHVAEREFAASLGSAFIGGRWAILITALVVGALRVERLRGSLAAEIAFGLLVAYNVAALAALYRLAPRKTPAILLLLLDPLAVGGIVLLTGGAGSPFIGLFYLITLAGALYYDLAGGLILAAAASACLAFRLSLTPGLDVAFLTSRTGLQHISGVILTGGFAGYLVGQLKRLHHRRIELEERLLRAWHDERSLLREARLDGQARQREADAARAIQLTILAPPPEATGFEIAVRYEPASEVGGDFYSFFPNRQRLGIVVGDVSGKGMGAALVSTSVSHLVHWLRPMQAPRQFMAALNHHLMDRVPEATFATMLFAVLDPRKKLLVAYSAGHPPPLIVSGDSVRTVHQPNLPLGILPEVRFVPERSPFEDGDTVVLYSDGFIEARNPAGEELSLEGLQALVRRHAHLPVEAMATQLVDDVRAFGTVTDDLTLVVVRMRR